MQKENVSTDKTTKGVVDEVNYICKEEQAGILEKEYYKNRGGIYDVIRKYLGCDVG